jgi:hypothetical protein
LFPAVEHLLVGGFSDEEFGEGWASAAGFADFGYGG